MTYRLVLAALAFLLGASEPYAQSSGSPLLERSKQYQTAMRAEDAAKVASFYADEAVTMPPGRAPVKGVKAIEADTRQMFQKSPGTTLTLRPITAEIAGELGYVHGEFVAEGKSGQLRGSYVEVWKRVGGEWKIVYDIWNSSQPPPPPPAAPKPPKPPMPPTPKQ